MALTNNFIPNLWSGSILKSLQQNTVFYNLFNKDYEGDVREGASLKIATISNPTVTDYTGTINYNEVDGNECTLDIDQKKYFAFKVDDVNKVQSAINLLDASTLGAGAEIAKTYDNFLCTKALEGATAFQEPAYKLDGKNGLKLISELMAKMDKANVPESDRYIVMSPMTSSKLLLELADKLTMNNNLISSGYIGSLFGFNFYKSNAINDTTILAGSKSYATTAIQLNEVETIRLENSFSDAVRGLAIYGATVTNSNAFYKVTIS